MTPSGALSSPAFMAARMRAHPCRNDFGDNDRFCRRRSLTPAQKRAPKVYAPRGPSPKERRTRSYTVSTLRASVQFTATLCETSGGFLIFPLTLWVGTITQRSALKTWLRGPTQCSPSIAPMGHGSPQFFKSVVGPVLVLSITRGAQRRASQVRLTDTSSEAPRVWRGQVQVRPSIYC